jgi:choline-sulfatase
LYDLNSDPEEMTNLAADPEYLEVLKKFETRLREILDPEAINDLALADQAALIERHGGAEKILERGGLYGTPASSGPSTRVAAKVS